MGETEEERRARKDRERAERKAKEAAEGKETEEERRARKDRERAERKAKEAAEGKETEEERRARKDRERAERKAKEAAEGKETEEERRARKERERGERETKEEEKTEIKGHHADQDNEMTGVKAKEPSEDKETESERRARKEKERAERRARDSGSESLRNKEDEVFTPHSRQAEIMPATMLPSKHQQLRDAIEEENRVATSRGSFGSTGRLGQSGSGSALTDEEKEREQRREERRLRKEQKLKEKESAEIDVGTKQVDTRSLERQGYRKQFEKDLLRATALRRLVDFDDYSVVVCDVTPQTEYDMYIRHFGGGKMSQVGTCAPDEEDQIDVAVQAERAKRKHAGLQAPDDLGLCPEQFADRWRLTQAAGNDENKNEEESFVSPKADNLKAVGSPTSPSTLKSPTYPGSPVQASGAAPAPAQAGVDAGKLGSFLNRIFPLVSALLDESSVKADGSSDHPSHAASKSSTSFSSSCISLSHPAVSTRPVTQVKMSITNHQSLSALYGKPAAPGPSPDLDVFASVILQWNAQDGLHPERALVSFTPLTCMCFSPSRSHLLYAGTADGCVCVWDTREPDRHHINAGKCDNLVLRLPSYSTTWKADNHHFPVTSICVAGYNTVVGVRREEFEQVVSLDRSGQIKFWAMNDKSHTGKDVSEHDYGLHMFSQVRLYLTSTREPNSLITAGSDSSARSSNSLNLSEATVLDFCPSDVSQFVIGMSNGLVHTNRFGTICAPATYSPSSSLICGPIQGPIPLCAQYCVTDSRLLVAGYDDGVVRLFLHTEGNPQLAVALGGNAPVKEVRFSGMRWLTWVLDEAGVIYLLDYAHKNRDQPILSEQFAQAAAGKCLSMDVPLNEKSDYRLLLGFEKGIVQIHHLDSEKLLQSSSERDEQWL